MSTDLGTLEPVDLRTIRPDEARNFTPWLAQEDNLRRLSEALNLELELDRKVVGVGPYKAEILATDTSSKLKVVIENQLEKANHDRLGKVLTYASGLEARILVWIAKMNTEEHRQTLITSTRAHQIDCASTASRCRQNRTSINRNLPKAP